MTSHAYIPKFVEQRQIDEPSDAIQTSSVFEIDGRPMAILTDTENTNTILSDIPSRLGDEVSVLAKSQTNPGIQVDLDVGARVEGYGVFNFPYGPVSSGIPEAGGFKLITYGERIVKVIPQINFKKRGVERRAIGMKPDDALLLIERSAGNFSASYSTCFVTTVENSLGLEVPTRARWIRAVALELERIYNHLYVFGRLAEAASQNVATAKANALRERVLRINAKYFHHRFLFGFNRVGGVNYDLPGKQERRDLFDSVRVLANEFSNLVSYFLSSRIFVDRLQNTAKLPKQDALKLGAVGPPARGSGLGLDDRLAFPIEPYNDIIVEVQIDNDEDTMARTLVRIQEIQSSTLILQQLLDRMPSGDVTQIHPYTEVPSTHQPENAFSFCRIESPSGDLIHVVELDHKGRIKTLHIRPSSLVNWLPFARSLEGNVFTDFQFAFESFGLVYADSDR
jgi:Ni,Fe-hydrogenase III large subunit